jgi:integrative and conjugative element protein (TIGR02256 family)
MRSLQKQIGTAWIYKNALAFMVQEFRRSLPNETGGVMVGYWLANSEGAVITHVVGPGPCARHGKMSFIPDGAYHDSEVARLYEESGRLHTYLGDWHSHPNSSTNLSPTDRRTLLKIANHAEARLPTPLMAIIAGSAPLILQIWRHHPLTALSLRTSKIVAVQIREFS